MFFLKEILDKCGLFLTPMQMTTHGSDHLDAVGRSALAQGVGLDILIEQLVRVQLRAVAGEDDQPQALVLSATKRLARAERCTGWPSTIR